MPEKQVTIHYTDDGRVLIERFADDEHLSKVKQLVDGLRGSNEELKSKAARVSDVDKLGTPEQIAEWKKRAEQHDKLQARITELEEKARMTEDEKKEFERLQAEAKKLEKFGDLDPDAAREALDFKARTEKERTLSEAFETAGFNPKAALRLDGIRDLEVRTQTETVDGKPVKTAQVKVGDSWQKLDSHVQTEYADFLPVLKPSDGGKDGGGNGGTAALDAGGRGRAPKGEAKSLADAIQAEYAK